MLNVVAISKEEEERQRKEEKREINYIMSTNCYITGKDMGRITTLMSTIPLIPPISGLDSLKTPLWGFFDDRPL